MLNKKVFEKNIFMVLYFQSVEVDKDKNEFLYNMMKNDFNDAEFEEICIDICKTEQLFNKYPTPNMFYLRQKKAQETILVEEGVFYLDDTIPAYKPYLNGFSNEDMEKVWYLIYNKKKGQFVSVDYVVEQIVKYKQAKAFSQNDSYLTYSEIKALISNGKEDKGFQ